MTKTIYTLFCFQNSIHVLFGRLLNCVECNLAVQLLNAGQYSWEHRSEPKYILKGKTTEQNETRVGRIRSRLRAYNLVLTNYYSPIVITYYTNYNITQIYVCNHNYLCVCFFLKKAVGIPSTIFCSCFSTSVDLIVCIFDVI